MNLIERAAQRLEKSQETSLIERLDAVEPAPDDKVKPDAKPDPSGPRAAAEPQAGAGVAHPAPEPAERRSETITIDFARLLRQGLVTPDNRRSRLSEEVRLIKRRLLRRIDSLSERRADSGKMDNVILVTSARPGEGKTFLSVNLALSLAIDEGINVLLVDADVVRPNVHATLGIRPKIGLTDILRSNGTLDVAKTLLRAEGLPLSVLTSGTKVASATELFGSEVMSTFVREIATRYSDRIIIFDSPPLLATTEPGVLAHHVGQVLFVVQAGKTSDRAVDTALELLGEHKNVSFALNRSFASSGLEQFGSYYYDYAGDSADTVEPDNDPDNDSGSHGRQGAE